MPISRTDPRIAAALEAALDRGEVGVQVAMYQHGELIVDACAGAADGAGSAVGAGTVFPILSASKAVVALAVHLQAERGHLDYDQPVADYWPEYAVHGKEAITVGQVLTHRAGVPQLPKATTSERLLDWHWMTTQLADERPMIGPGSASAYHALSMGWILAELVVRTDPRHRDYARFVAEEICAPLGIAALWFGIPAEDEGRCARVGGGYPPAEGLFQAAAVPPAVGRPEQFQNRSEFRRACVPAGNGIADARSLARLYTVLAGRGMVGRARLLSEQRVESFLVPRSASDPPDLVLQRSVHVGRGGFHIDGDDPALAVVLGRSPGLLCIPGGGGTFGWANLDTGVAAAICHNRLFAPPDDPRAHPFYELGRALREIADDPAT